ncbi:hypothetical protein R6Z07M_009264 [Ovis aries]
MQTEVDKLNEQSPQKARLKVSNISAVKGRKASADGSSWRPFLDPTSGHTRGTEPPLTPLRPAFWERGSQPLCPSNKEPGKPRDGGGVPPPPPERRSAGGRVLTSPLGPVSPMTAPGFPCEQSAPLICSGQAERRQGQLGGLLPGRRSTLGPQELMTGGPPPAYLPLHPLSGVFRCLCGRFHPAPLTGTEVAPEHGSAFRKDGDPPGLLLRSAHLGILRGKEKGPRERPRAVTEESVGNRGAGSQSAQLRYQQ